jgi:glycosyltransferase involved in cell wall biosynthesis
VIATFDRPLLVLRAVASALAQSETRLEVIVVIDGPNAAIVNALQTVGDPRLRVVELPQNVGPAGARNRGFSEATAPWVALLDDDDEWLPDKLRIQLDLATTSGARLPIVGSRLIARTPGADLVLPRRLPRPDEPMSEYLTVRHHLFHGEGYLQSSTLFAPAELFRSVPFRVGSRFDDLDWVLRATRVPGTAVACAAEPLSIWYEDVDRPRISLRLGWRPTFDWITANRELFTPRAYAAVQMGLVSSLAAPIRDRRAFRMIAREAFRHGEPHLLELVTFAQVWLVPQRLRHAIRDLVTRRSRRYRG